MPLIKLPIGRLGWLNKFLSFFGVGGSPPPVTPAETFRIVSPTGNFLKSPDNNFITYK